MNRLKSFTVVELLVVIIISSILVLMSGGVFFYISQYKYQLDKKALPVNLQARLHYLLKYDLGWSEALKLSGDSLIFGNKQKRSVYWIGEEFSLRIQGAVIDTFKYKLALEEQVKTENLLRSGVVEYTDTLGIPGLILLKKTYSSEQLFNLTEDDEPK